MKWSKILFNCKKDSRITQKKWFFSKFSNDPKNVSGHCGSHYNIKIKHFEHFSGGGGSWSHPSCQIGLTLKENKLRSDSLLDDFQTISYQMFYKIDSSRLWILLYVKKSSWWLNISIYWGKLQIELSSLVLSLVSWYFNISL